MNEQSVVTVISVITAAVVTIATLWIKARSDRLALEATTLDRWKRENHKPFPTCRDVLRVLKSLGYKKPQPDVAAEGR